MKVSYKSDSFYFPFNRHIDLVQNAIDDICLQFIHLARHLYTDKKNWHSYCRLVENLVPIISHTC